MITKTMVIQFSPSEKQVWRTMGFFFNEDSSQVTIQRMAYITYM